MAAMTKRINCKQNPIKKNIILILVISFSLVGIARAEQTEAARYLMTEPLTLFDLGMYKLNELLNEDPSVNATVTFDWKTNNINLNVMILEFIAQKGAISNSQNKAQAYGLIRLIVNSIRTKLGVDYRTGKIISGDTALEACFRPASGRTIKNEPENLKAVLFDMTNITVHFAGENFNLKGRASLKGTNVIFDE